MLTDHWNNIFKKVQPTKLGWYENDFSQTFKFLNFIGTLENKVVFLAGVGTSNLADQLIGKCKNLLLNDLSQEALSILKDRVGKTNQKIEWINEDIGTDLPLETNSIDVWIDRAVLHFLTKEEQIKKYFNNLNEKIKQGGYALLAEFSDIGAPKCAGLELHRYTIEELTKRCGKNFKLINSESFVFINPNGEERPYIYSLFQKII